MWVNNLSRLRYLFLIYIVLFGCGHKKSTNNTYCINRLVCNPPLVVGHRGNVEFAPGNTLVAFQKAYELGVDGVELDVRHTKDNALVVFHDPTVDAKTDGHGAVDELTLDDIKKLNIISHYEGVEDQKIPTFKEALEFIKELGNLLVDVDIKTDHLDDIVNEILNTGMKDRVFLLAKGLEKAKYLSSLNSGIAIMGRAGSYEEVEEYIKIKDCILVEVDIGTLTKEQIERLGKEGIGVFVDSLGPYDLAADTYGPEKYRDLVDKGFHIIQTDRAELLIEYLSSVGKR